VNDREKQGTMMADAETTSDVAVITGGASGFGLAMADQCAARGMRPVLLDRDLERAEQEAMRLSSEYGIDTLGLGVDIADAQAVARAASVVSDRFGHANLVISNVGVQLFGAVDRLSDDEWRWVLDVNVVGSARVARCFLPLLDRAPHGRLAFTASSSVLDPSSRLAAYQASKFAVWGLAETLRLEWADKGIHIAVIFPSGMTSRHLETSAAAQPDHIRRPIGDDEDFTAMAASNPAMVKQITSPEDAARGALDALLANEAYIVTHGDLTDAVAMRAEQLARAADAAR